MENREQQRQMSVRRTYADCLKIIAAFAVMVLHTAAQYSASVTGSVWDTFQFYDAVVRWAVPVFVMVSGALFLDGNRSMMQICKKNILRIVTAFLFWSFLYALINLLTTPDTTVKNALRWFVEGPTHMWFLFMIIGLYMLVPFLQKITNDRKLTGYFVVLSLLFTFLLPYCVMLLSFSSEKAASIAASFLGKVDMYFVCGYVSYFVGGYFLQKIEIKGKWEWLVYFLGICGFVVTIFFAKIFSVPKEETAVVFHDNFTVNVLFESVAVFVFAKNHLTFSKAGENVKKTFRRLSEYSFGAYLVHAMVITQLNHILGLNTLSFHPALSVPVIAGVTFIISFTISGFLHKIPILNQYIV